MWKGMHSMYGLHMEVRNVTSKLHRGALKKSRRLLIQRLNKVDPLKNLRVCRTCCVAPWSGELTFTENALMSTYVFQSL